MRSSVTIALLEGEVEASRKRSLSVLAAYSRLTARHASGDITDEEHKELLQMLLDKEDTVK